MSTAGSRLEALLTYHMGQRLETEWIEKDWLQTPAPRWRCDPPLALWIHPDFDTHAATLSYCMVVSGCRRFSFRKNSFPVLFFWAGRCAMLFLPSLVTAPLAAACGCLRGVRMKAS
jgi:hypothetical protein